MNKKVFFSSRRVTFGGIPDKQKVLLRMSRNPIDVPLDCEIKLRFGDFKQRDFDLLVERVGDNDKSAGFFAYGNAIECYDRLCRERLQVDECGLPVLVSFLFHPITSWSDVALKEMEIVNFQEENFCNALNT